MEAQERKDLEIILTVLDANHQTLADEIGVDRSLVTRTLNGARRSPAVRKKLSKAICTRIERLIGSSPEKSDATA